MRIVIVEDNIAVAKGIAYRLQDEGHAVDLIHDGAEADVFLRDDGADLVILDIKLPGMAGLDVLAGMRQRGERRPVLVLTAHAELSDKVAGLDAGADDYLAKPFEFEELRARIRALSRRGPVADRSLFQTLLNAQGRYVSKQALLDSLYGTGSDVEEAVVEVYVSRLRKRLRGFNVEILVRRGIGYSMAEAAT